MQSRSKQFTIGILLLLTLVLAAASIFIALSLRGTPDTGVAQSCIVNTSRDQSACSTYACTNLSVTECQNSQGCCTVSGTAPSNCVLPTQCQSGAGFFCGANFDAVKGAVCNSTTGAVLCSCVPKSTGTTCNNNGICDAGESATCNDCKVTTGGGFSPRLCEDKKTTSATTWCLIFTCPNGDTDGNGKCQSGDEGATERVSTSEAECDAVPNGCYQVDYYKQPPAASSNANDANFCHFRLNLNCGGGDDVTPQNPRFNIRKTIAGNAGNTFRVGDTIPFRVVITNTGNTTFTTLRFRDNFESEYLEFIDGTVTLRNQSGTITTADINATTGNINIENILTRLNNINFRPDDQVVIRLNFEAIKATDGEQTRNRAFAKAGDEDEEQDNEDVEIVEEDELICGDECTSTTQCPTNHTCSSGTCVLNSCLSNPGACTDNGCQLLPDTGILDEPYGLILVGSILLLLGLLAYQVNLRAAMFGLLMPSNKKLAVKFLPDSKEKEILQSQIEREAIENRKLSKDKSRKSYEDKFRI